MNMMKHSSNQIEALTNGVRHVLKIAAASTLIAAAWPGVGVADSYVPDETLTGKIIGYNCAHQGISCAVDRDDPHLSLEQDFVLIEDSGEPYLLIKLDRNTKKQYVLEAVMITGALNKRYKAVTVNEFKVKRDDTYETVWSPELERKNTCVLAGPARMLDQRANNKPRHYNIDGLLVQHLFDILGCNVP